MSCAMFLIFREDLMAEDRDPFISSLDLEKQKAKMQITKRIDLSQLILKGIIWNEKLSVAIINDDLFMVGDDCKGLKIKSIDRGSVTLSDGIDSFNLALADDVVPKEKTQVAESLQEAQPKGTDTQPEEATTQDRRRSYPNVGFRSQPQGRSPLPSFNMNRNDKR
jgi:hypothetical protein